MRTLLFLAFFLLQPGCVRWVAGKHFKLQNREVVACDNAIIEDCGLMLLGCSDNTEHVCQHNVQVFK